MLDHERAFKLSRKDGWSCFSCLAWVGRSIVWILGLEELGLEYKSSYLAGLFVYLSHHIHYNHVYGFRVFSRG